MSRADLDTQRALFEAWHFPLFGSQKLLGESDQYYLSSTQGAWQAWQAALAAQAPVQDEPKNITRESS